MSDTERMKIINQLNTRTLCPSCKQPNQCAVDQGKSISACWCISLPTQKHKLQDFSTCFCKKCLDNSLHE